MAGGWVAMGLLFVGLLSSEADACNEEGRSEGCRIVPTKQGRKKSTIYIFIQSSPGKVHTSVFVGWAVVEDFPFNLGTSVRHRS